MTADHPHDGSSSDLGALLHAAFRGLRHSWTEQLAPWEITPFQWRALHTIMRMDDGVRLGVIAERLRIAARSATEVVDQLEDKGLVRRAPDPSDRRAVIVEATPSGLDLHDAVMAKRRERADEYFGVLSAEEQSQLLWLLSRLSHRG